MHLAALMLICQAAAYGMPTRHKDRLNADLLTLVKT